MPCKLHGRTCTGHAKTAKEERAVLERSDFATLLQAAKTTEERAIFLLIYDLALRAGEVERQLSRNVDLKAGAIGVPRLKDGKLAWIGASKTTLDAIKPFLKKDGGPIFPDWPRDRVCYYFRLRAKEAGLPARKRYSHILRASRATHLNEAGAELKDIQRRLGHRSPQSTLIYLHLTEARKREVDRVAGEMIEEMLLTSGRASRKV